MSDQPETTPNPEPVDLGYLGDRARAYVIGLEARLKQLRTENDELRAHLHRDADGDWLNEAGNLLTSEPEPATEGGHDE